MDVATRNAPTATLIVHLGLATGADITLEAQVRLIGEGYERASAEVQVGSEMTFEKVPLGEYYVEVSAPGFATSREAALLTRSDATTYVFVNLKPDSSLTSVLPEAPPLPSKARKEAEKGLAALRRDKLKDAEKHIERALKIAPRNPLVNYLGGLVALRQERPEQAKERLETATRLEPIHSAWFETLGSVQYKLGDTPGAIDALQQALVLDPNRWEAHWTLAAAYFRQDQFEEARAYAERAKDLSKGQSPEIQVLLGLSLARLGQKAEAEKELKDFLAQNPGHNAAKNAREALQQLNAPGGEGGRFALGALAPSVGEVGAPGARWAPPDTASFLPPVAPGVECSLGEVLEAAGARVLSLGKNLERIGATERVDYSDFDRDGYLHSSGSSTFEYVVGISETRPGSLSVEEYRSPARGSARGSTPRVLTTGLAAMAFIFHPYYSPDFEMTCEGLGQWRGEPAWQVHFQQRSDKPGRILVYRSGRRTFPVAQKGRAWIDANTHQILRLETDLVHPVPEIEFEKQHLAIEYGPVDFQKRKVHLWLPATVELHAQIRGHRMRHLHVFRDFVLFTVDARQEIHAPSVPDSPPERD